MLSLIKISHVYRAQGIQATLTNSLHRASYPVLLAEAFMFFITILISSLIVLLSSRHCKPPLNSIQYSNYLLFFFCFSADFSLLLQTSSALTPVTTNPSECLGSTTDSCFAQQQKGSNGVQRVLQRKPRIAED